MGLYEFAAQGVQFQAASFENRPGGQGSQVSSIVISLMRLYLPAAHLVQPSLLPEPPAYPGEQAEAVGDGVPLPVGVPVDVPVLEGVWVGVPVWVCVPVGVGVFELVCEGVGVFDSDKVEVGLFDEVMDGVPV